MNRKITFIIAFFTLAVNYTSAQISFSASRLHDLNVDSDGSKTSHDAKTYLHNNSTDLSDTLFEWEIVDMNRPDGWELTVCSGLLCIAEPKKPYGVSVENSDSLDFKLGFYFGADERGSADVSLIIKSVKNPETVRDTLVFSMFLRSHANVGSMNKPKFDIYPNPAKDFFTIEFENSGSERVSVYDILGNQHIAVNVNSGDRIDIAGLAKGVYIVRTEGEQAFSKVLQIK